MECGLPLGEETTLLRIMQRNGGRGNLVGFEANFMVLGSILG